MKVLLINVVCGVGSTGRICVDTAKKYLAEGNDCFIAYGRGNAPEEIRDNTIRIGSDADVYSHLIYSRLFDRQGFGSKRATKRFLSWVEQYKPDLIWLHNLHGYYINIEMLFKWLNDHQNVKVKWTLHDCWAFTGHCCHFTFVKCDNWKTGCLKCNQKGSYPSSLLLSNSQKNYKRKRELFCGRDEMDIIVPSKWLGSLAQNSFLGKYSIQVSYNKIDTNVFKPTESDYRTKYGFDDKYVLLGVANDWNEKKGLNDILKLHQLLDERYVIVLIGIKNNQVNTLCKSLSKQTLNRKALKNWNKPICISQGKNNLEETAFYYDVKSSDYSGAALYLFPNLKSAQELAKFYTLADLFINTTYEDTYPTVNLESQACGTPVITYKTGGSVESVPEENHVDTGNVNQLAKVVNEVISRARSK